MLEKNKTQKKFMTHEFKVEASYHNFFEEVEVESVVDVE